MSYPQHFAQRPPGAYNNAPSTASPGGYAQDGYGPSDGMNKPDVPAEPAYNNRTYSLQSNNSSGSRPQGAPRSMRQPGPGYGPPNGYPPGAMPPQSRPRTRM